MKHILVAWWDSLKMLAPSNLKPLALVTLKTLFEVYKTVVVHCWWFLALGCIPAWHLLSVPGSAGIVGLTAWTLLWISLLILIARPSVELKNREYVFKYGLVWFLFAGLILGVWITPLNLLGKIALMPYVMFLYFFVADAYYTFSELMRAPWSALKLSFALLPLYLLVAAVFYGISLPLLLWSGLGGVVVGLLALLVWLLVVIPLFIVFISRLYIIAIHKNYKEYYERCW